MSAIRAVLAVIIVFLAGMAVHYGWSAETNNAWVPFGALLFCIALIIGATADEV
jgi:hypothetical protein